MSVVTRSTGMNENGQPQHESSLKGNRPSVSRHNRLGKRLHVSARFVGHGGGRCLPDKKPPNGGKDVRMLRDDANNGRWLMVNRTLVIVVRGL